MVSHLDSLWNRGTRELGNGLFTASLNTGKTRDSLVGTRQFNSNSSVFFWLFSFVLWNQ